jgi:hypothetical protein
LKQNIKNPAIIAGHPLGFGERVHLVCCVPDVVSDLGMFFPGKSVNNSSLPAKATLTG